MSESESVKKPAKMQYEIETANGRYKIRRPVGKAGARHFALMQKCLPSYIDEETGKPMFSEADKERASEAFEMWAGLVLPYVVIEGPYVPEEMPGEDQYAIFAAILQSTVTNVGTELFRVIE